MFKKYVPPAAESQEKREELIVQRQLISVPQRFATGPLFGKFLAELRDNKRIIGNKCPRCGRSGHQMEDKLYQCLRCKMLFDGEEDGTIGYGPPSRRIEREERQLKRSKERKKHDHSRV